MMKTIAIITGGNSAEHEISLQSAKVVKSNLDNKKYNAMSNQHYISFIGVCSSLTNFTRLQYLLLTGEKTII